MNKSLWRVVWNLAGQDTHSSLEFSSEDKAMEWAEGLLRGNANGISVTELIVGRTIQIKPSSSPTQDLFSNNSK